MSSQPEVCCSNRWRRAALITSHALGLVVVISATWGWFSLLTGPPRSFSAPGWWLEVVANAPLFLLSCFGGIGLLRGKRAGYSALYAVLLVSLGAWAATYLPPLHRHFPLHLFGWPLLGGFLNLVALVVLAVCQIATRTIRTEPTPGFPPLLYFGLCVFVSLAVVLGCRRAMAGDDGVAGQLVQWGNDAHEAGDPDEALRQWERVMAQFPHTSAWGMAVFNSGVVHRQLGHFGEAIALFEQLLSSRVNDMDPGEELMETNRNYRHRACVGISACYEQQSDPAGALRYARLARDRYPFQSWCGTCMREANAAVRERIEQLEQQVGDAHRPAQEAR
jgi:hypothetical protein